MAPVNVQQLNPGDRVTQEFLVLDREEKRPKMGGDPFYILTLGNASGNLQTAPIWPNQVGWVDGADRGKIVQAIGQVGVYAKTGQRQIQLSAPLRVLPATNYEDFLPRISSGTGPLWDWVDSKRVRMQSATLKRVLGLFFDDDDFRQRFERTPGSTGGHHAKLGGLLLHVYEVASVARTTARTMKANEDLVLAGALLHDIGKVDAYEIGPTGFTFSPCGLLIGHVVLGVLMLERAMAKLGERVCTEGQLLDLQHLILAHHGKMEHGSPVEPMTAEAEIVHWADEASAKANDMMESIDDDDVFANDSDFSSRKVWRVGRRVWRRPHGWE
jgi:3'-5' exoribonuclease